MGSEKRLYILDTNVLMHDPTALFRFEEHDIFLPMMVLEELDAAKKGLSEVARNVRQVSRFIDEMMQRQEVTRLDDGLDLILPEGIEFIRGSGKLYFQTSMPETLSSLLRDGSFADNEILSTALSLQKEDAKRKIVLVSKDINLRIKAAILGVQAEDYYNDRALDDLSMLYRGTRNHAADFWDAYPELESWNGNGRTFYRFNLKGENGWYPNQCISIGDENGVEAIVKELNNNSVKLQLVDDYYEGHKSVWGVHARNREQNFALNLLMDPDIDFVTLLGTAGTGKTLLALAAGLAQVMDEKRYSEIIVTRATVPIGGYRSYQGVVTIKLKVLRVVDGRPAGEEVREETINDSKRYGITNPAANVPLDREYFFLGETPWGTEDFHQTLVGGAVDQALGKLSADLANLVQPRSLQAVSAPKIIDIDGLQVYINIGLADSVQNGDKFGVWDHGRELRDPQTKVVLGFSLPRRVGVVQIEQVLNEHLSTGRVLEAQDQIEKEYTVRAE